MINNKQTNKLEQTHTEGIKQGLEGTEAERPEQDVWIAPEFNHDVQTHFNVRCDFLLYVTSLSLPLSLSPSLPLSLSFSLSLSLFLYHSLCLPLSLSAHGTVKCSVYVRVRVTQNLSSFSRVLYEWVMSHMNGSSTSTTWGNMNAINWSTPLTFSWLIQTRQIKGGGALGLL